jgi:iron complex transport system substrate-binding protein
VARTATDSTHRNRFRLSHRLFLIMALLSVLVLSACTSSGSQPADNAETSGQTAGKEKEAGSAEQKEPKSDQPQVSVIEHAMGKTEIKGTPKRIVTLTQDSTDGVLALGFKPVGAVAAWNGDPWYDFLKDALTGVEVVGQETQPNLENIVALQPDLIIGTKLRHEKIYEELSAIAPTVFTETIGMAWKDNFQFYGKVLNPDKGAEVLAAWDNRVADFKQKMAPTPTTTASLVRFRANEVRIYVTGFPGKVLEEAGVSRPETQQKEKYNTQVLTLTKEQIPLMDADVLFYMTSNWDDKKQGSIAQHEWMEHPLWKSLDVIKSNQVYEVDEVAWNLSGGIQGANRMLDDLYKIFLNK